MTISTMIRVLAVAMLLLSATVSAEQRSRQLGPNDRIEVAPGERLLSPINIDIKLSADGQITALRHEQEIDEIALSLERAIRSWKFAPAMEKGEPVDSATRIITWLVAVPIGDRFGLKVREISLTEVWYDYSKRFVAPRYPKSMRRISRDAKVLLLVKPSESGGRGQVLSGSVNGKPASRSNPFLVAATDAVERWPYVVLEWDGKRYADQLCVPVSFSVDDARRDPVADRVWQTEKERSEACHHLEGSTWSPGDESIRLIDDVVGKTL